MDPNPNHHILVCSFLRYQHVVCTSCLKAFIVFQLLNKLVLTKKMKLWLRKKGYTRSFEVMHSSPKYWHSTYGKLTQLNTVAPSR